MHHHGYIARIKASMTALGVDADRLDIVIMQMVNLVRNGEKYKLSKRSGKAITLSTLLDEIPIDAARFSSISVSLILTSILTLTLLYLRQARTLFIMYSMHTQEFVLSLKR